MYKTHFRYFPIGQGCFYVGQIFARHRSLFNFVYDCGTNSDQDYLINAIDNWPIKRSTNSHINVCIISHFHYDHVSGIPHLLKGTRCDRLVIPYYKPNERLIIYMKSTNTDDEYRRMMEDPFTYFSGDDFNIGEIVVVSGGPENQSPEPARPIAPEPESATQNQEDFRLGKNVTYIDDWQNGNNNQTFFQQLSDREQDANLNKVNIKMIPYQMRTPLYKFIFYCRTIEGGNDADAKIKIEQMEKQIENYYERELRNPDSIVLEFKDLFNAVHIKEITRIYGSIFGGTSKLNGTSLAVFHQSVFGSNCFVTWRTLNTRFAGPYLRENEHGSLMTGDLDLETKEKLELFQEYYQYYLGNVGYFQVMHHGSDRNWPFGIPTSKLHSFPAYVINHGVGRAHHPGREVSKLLRMHQPHNVFLNNEFSQFSYGYSLINFI